MRRGGTIAVVAAASITMGGSSVPPLPATDQQLVLSEAHGTPHPVLAIDPRNGGQVMYLAMGHLGILKSTNGGATWTPKNFGLPASFANTIVIDPADRDHLLVAFNGDVAAQGPRPYESFDGGERWEPTVVCEHLTGTPDNPQNSTNVLQVANARQLVFDPYDSDYLYYLVDSQGQFCGGFYRSCDRGVSYDWNPRCDWVPRTACAAGDPLPDTDQYIQSNDASVIAFHRGLDPVTGVLFEELYSTTGTHGAECALMTSSDKGSTFFWGDTVDTRGTFSDHGVGSLFVSDLVSAPSASSTRYASGPLNVSDPMDREWCNDGRAHPTAQRCLAAGGALVFAPSHLMSWFGEYSGGVDCHDLNDCDGDPAPDRVWRPIFDGSIRPHHKHFSSIAVHLTDRNRIFASYNGVDPAGPDTTEVLMLTPPSQSDPSGTPWSFEVLYSSEQYNVNEIVRHPTDANCIYLLGNAKAAGANQLHRITTKDRWLTWDHTILLDMGELFEVNDLIQVKRAWPKTDGLVVGTSAGHSIGNGFDSFTSISGAAVAALASAPSNPGRWYSKGNRYVRTFDPLLEPCRVAPQIMDSALNRQAVMCTNIFTSLVVHPEVDSLLYATTEVGIWENEQAYCTIDGETDDTIARAWRPLGLNDEYVWSMLVDPKAPSRLLAGTRGAGIFESLNGGQTWSAIPIQDQVKDVRDLELFAGHAFAATASGVFQRTHDQGTWLPTLADERVVELAPGASGTRRMYAAADSGVFRTLDAGGSWQRIALSPVGPHKVVLETRTWDGRHHLWLSERGRGLWRISTTLASVPGSIEDQVMLSWVENANHVVGYRLHYGADPDLLGGTGAVEGPSPIVLGPVTSTTLSGLDFRAAPIHIVLEAVFADGGVNRGLPLAIDFDYAFAPAATVSDAGTCPPGLRLDWNAVPGATGYRVYRSMTGEEPFELVTPTSFTGISFVDTGLTDRTMYHYYVSSIFPGDETLGREILSNQARLDRDGDGDATCQDNCPSTFNPTQADSDGDGVGNACDDWVANPNPAGGIHGRRIPTPLSSTGGSSGP